MLCALLFAKWLNLKKAWYDAYEIDIFHYKRSMQVCICDVLTKGCLCNPSEQCAIFVFDRRLRFWQYAMSTYSLKF